MLAAEPQGRHGLIPAGTDEHADYSSPALASSDVEDAGCQSKVPFDEVLCWGDACIPFCRATFGTQNPPPIEGPVRRTVPYLADKDLESPELLAGQITLLSELGDITRIWLIQG